MKTSAPRLTSILLLVVPAAAALAACAGTDSGTGSGSSGEPSANGVGAGDGTANEAGATSSSGTGGSSGTSGSPGIGGDSGSSGPRGDSGSSGSSGSSGTPAVDAFTGAPAFQPVSNPGTRCRKPGDHPWPNGNPAGQPCNSCHEHSNAFGGTIYKDMQGAIPAPGVEVRLRDGAGHTVSTHTDQDGNFLMGGGGVTLPAYVGVRDATMTRPMATELTSAMTGSCAAATCHTGSYSGGPIFGGSGYWAVHLP